MTSFFSHQHRTILRRREERRPGYLDTFDVVHQLFVLEHKALWGLFTYRRDILFQEEVPNEVLDDMAFLGYTNWRSTCPDAIFEKCSKKVRTEGLANGLAAT